MGMWPYLTAAVVVPGKKLEYEGSDGAAPRLQPSEGDENRAIEALMTSQMLLSRVAPQPQSGGSPRNSGLQTSLRYGRLAGLRATRVRQETITAAHGWHQLLLQLDSIAITISEASNATTIHKR